MFGSNKGLMITFAVVAIIFAIGGWKFPAISDALNLAKAPEISKTAQIHILEGDENGGGHKYGSGKPCKSEFPAQWDEAEILSNVRAIAANDNLDWKKQKNGYYVATDTVDDVDVRVVLDKERDGVVTAYPVGGKTNDCPVEKLKVAENKKPAKASVQNVKKIRHASAPRKKPVDEPTLPNASSRQPRTYNFNR